MDSEPQQSKGRVSQELVLNRVLEAVRATISRHSLAGARTPVVLMVSGGSDSTAMARLAARLHVDGALGPLAMLHVNHQIRGEEADADQRFVEQLAEELNIPLTVCSVDIPALAEQRGENLEAVARSERYRAANELLGALCEREGVPTEAGRVFVAHTQDDRVENFYMRSIVGTGPGGFRSMRYLNGNVARPCLDVSRQDLRDYLQAEAAIAAEKGDAPEAAARNAAEPQLWCEDATNAHTDRFRAFVRHKMVPVAKERNPRLLDTLTRTMNVIADEDDMVARMADELRGRCVVAIDASDLRQGVLFRPAFGEAPVPLQRRAVVDVLTSLLPPAARVEFATVAAVLAAWKDGAPISGYTANIQGNLAVSANKRGVRLEPMAIYRARRKRG